MAVVVVESPAKAKTINKYLGSDYTVLASYGHVRDLPPKDGSVDPENGFEMLWEVDSKAARHLRAISDALKDDGELVLTVLRCVNCGYFAELDVDVIRQGRATRVAKKMQLRPDEAFAIAGNPILYPAPERSTQ